MTEENKKPIINLSNHQECPFCKNVTLPKLAKDSRALGSRCRECGQYTPVVEVYE